MKKYWASIILFSFPFHFALAQLEGQFLADSLEQVLKAKNTSGKDKVDLLTHLSYEYRNLLPAKAIEYAEQAKKLAEQIHYDSKLGEIYLSLGYSYSFYNDRVKAYEYSLLAVKYNTDYNILDVLPNSKIWALSTNGNIKNEDRKDSLIAILKDLDKIQDREWYVKAVGSLGNEFILMSEIKTGDSLLDIAINDARKYHYKFLEMHNIGRKGMAFINKFKADSGVILINGAIKYLKSIQEKRILCEFLHTTAIGYYQKYSLDTTKKKCLDSSETFIKQSFEIANPIDYKLNKLNNCYLGYFISIYKGKPMDALTWLEQYTDLNDELYGKDARRKLEALVIKQKDEITAKEISLKNLELNRQKTIRNISFIAASALLLLSAAVIRQRNRTKKEKKRSDELLLNILPSEVAEELKQKGSAETKQFDQVSVMFTDFKGFTQISEKLSPTELVNEIDTCFKAFDNIVTKYGIEKIKTIGDSYMCAGGLPVANKTNATDVINAAMEIQAFMKKHNEDKAAKGLAVFEIRIGVHTGSVVAGIVGVKKFAYDIWGDTVNIASRMESSGEAGKVNISGTTYGLVKDKFNCIYRGKVQAKNKGEIDMYFVESPTIDSL